MTWEDQSAADLVQALPAPVLVMAVDGRIERANPLACALLGVDRGENRNVLEFLSDGERARLDPLAWMRHWADRPDAPELQFVHLTLTRADGKQIPVRTRVARLDGAFVVLLNDIGAELERTHESREANLIARRTLDISADAVLMVDQDGRIEYANQSAHRLFGYPPGALRGLDLDKLIPASRRDEHPARLRRFAEAPEPARLMSERPEIQGLDSEGREIPLEISISKVTVGERRVFCAVIRDLRARKRQQQALEQADARFRTVFEHALQAMALISPDGLVLAMNPAAIRLLPPGTEAIGKPFAQLPFWSEDAAATAARLEHAVAACLLGETHRESVHVRMPDGRAQRFDFSLAPVADADRVFAIVAEARALPDAE